MTYSILSKELGPAIGRILNSHFSNSHKSKVGSVENECCSVANCCYLKSFIDLCEEWA